MHPTEQKRHIMSIYYQLRLRWFDINALYTVNIKAI